MSDGNRILKVIVRLTVGDHGGYCSGSDCYDTVTLHKLYFLVNDDDQEKDGDGAGFADNLDYDQLLEVIRDGDFVTIPEIGGESGYCGASESGLHHDYTMEIDYVEALDWEEVSDAVKNKAIECDAISAMVKK